MLVSAVDFNPDIWLDGVDTNSLVLSGDSVVQWKNKGSLGTNCNAVAPAATNQPTYDSTRSVVFDGVYDGLKITNGSAYGPGNTVTLTGINDK